MECNEFSGYVLQQTRDSSRRYQVAYGKRCLAHMEFFYSWHPPRVREDVKILRSLEKDLWVELKAAVGERPSRARFFLPQFWDQQDIYGRFPSWFWRNSSFRFCSRDLLTHCPAPIHLECLHRLKLVHSGFLPPSYSILCCNIF